MTENENRFGQNDQEYLAVPQGGTPDHYELLGDLFRAVQTPPESTQTSDASNSEIAYPWLDFYSQIRNPRNSRVLDDVTAIRLIENLTHGLNAELSAIEIKHIRTIATLAHASVWPIQVIDIDPELRLRIRVQSLTNHARECSDEIAGGIWAKITDPDSYTQRVQPGEYQPTSDLAYFIALEHVPSAVAWAKANPESPYANLIRENRGKVLKRDKSNYIPESSS